jgi:hypothetical protein
VDGSDFALLAGNFGRRVPDAVGVGLTAGDWEALEAFGTSIGVPVPEPATATLVTLAAAGLLLRRNGRRRPRLFQRMMIMMRELRCAIPDTDGTEKSTRTSSPTGQCDVPFAAGCRQRGGPGRAVH